jgi:hypothetical protein
MAEYVTRDAIQLFGAMGYAEETDVSRYFADARVLGIFEGAEEVLALRVIGRALENSRSDPGTEMPATRDSSEQSGQHSGPRHDLHRDP